MFHPLTYEGSVDIDSISDPIQKRAMELQINEFGQTPKQLFKIPHPPRHMVSEEEKSVPNVKTSRMTWNIEHVAKKSGSEVTEITLHKKRVSSIHQLGDKAVTTGHDGCLKVTNLEKIQKRSFPVCELAISCSALINDKTIAAGSYDNKIYIFNLSTGRVANTFQAHDDAITSIEYIESMSSIVSGSWDGLVKLWDVREKPKAVHSFEDHEEQVTCICIDPTKNNPYLVVSCDLDGKVVLRDLREGVISRYDSGSQVITAKHSLHSSHVILAQPERIAVFEKDGSNVTSLNIEGVNTLATDGVFVLSGKEDGNMELWELMKGDCVYRWNDVSKITSLYVDQTADTFLAGNIEGNLYYIH